MRTGNLQFVKQMNKSIVLDRIIQLEPISRADIAQNTGLNKGTVSSLVSELLEESLVYESGPGESSGGRRPVLLHFNKKAGFSIGIDIGGNYLLGILTDLTGTILTQNQILLTDTDFGSVSHALKSLIESLVQSAPQSPYGIVGMGIGVPGIVTDNRKILFTPNLNFQPIDLKEIVEEWFKVPVIIENEANAGAYGEKRYGAGINMNELVYISAGIGIGTGIIIDEKLYSGTSGFSGELGHMTINTHGEKCRCGNYGCWELYASELALINEAKRLLPDLPSEKQSVEGLIDLARKQDPTALSIFEKIGEALGIGLVNIINGLNPQKIIIGNRLALAGEWLKDPIQKVLAERTLKFNLENVDISFSEHASLSTALGTSAFAIDHFRESLFDRE